MIEKTIKSITPSGKDHYKVVFDDGTFEHLTALDFMCEYADFEEKNIQSLVGRKFNVEI